jgi:DNA polymerase-3 subunit gamma/tau
MLSKGAFNALLKILEEPPVHLKFILATTEIHKVPETILSRCQRFDFKNISEIGIKKYLKMIAEKEGIKTEEKAINYIIKNSA